MPLALVAPALVLVGVYSALLAFHATIRAIEANASSSTVLDILRIPQAWPVLISAFELR